MGKLCVLVSLAVFVFALTSAKRYQPNWESLDARPLPAWYDEAKIGIFLHWGVYSVPAFGSAWFWYYLYHGVPAYVEFMKQNYRPGFTYQDFAADFHASFFDPDEWADIFLASGARYVVLVTKHHEGFTMWPSKYSFNWNAGAVGPKRDLLGDLLTAVRAKGMHFGVYHSLFEFFNPLYLEDKANNYTTRNFPTTKTMPELYELVNTYQPELIWSDGPMDGPESYWGTLDFLAWLYNDSPVKDYVVVNDRWGNDTICHHGGFWDCSDKYNPGVLQPHKWESAMTVDRHSWTHRRNINFEDVLSLNELLTVMARTISCGGNLLMNVGPSSDGRIIPIFEERLRQFGKWMAVNGEAIYYSKPWHTQQDNATKSVWYTSQKLIATTAVYAIVLEWPGNNTLSLQAPIPTPSTTVELLGYPGKFLKYIQGAMGTMDILLPILNPVDMPSTDGWVIKMKNLKNQ
ncbi:alpha-L-fucosidase-like [Mizuhopecten yessoensis]|uniref:alpha-L-fucosidase n=1 Tax=Mizuhopecten yessoensis TaxID=6573 RepID=A0A210R6M7_MIZYE|nr:alpha-L-fucosidase-like [Mizuhopecten yessoensis]OWF56521.1 Alpha-L-fucosidase [Mizuhopecten yessoensis]